MGRLRAATSIGSMAGSTSATTSTGSLDGASSATTSIASSAGGACSSTSWAAGKSEDATGSSAISAVSAGAAISSMTCVSSAWNRVRRDLSGVYARAAATCSPRPPAWARCALRPRARERRVPRPRALRRRALQPRARRRVSQRHFGRRFDRSSDSTSVALATAKRPSRRRQPAPTTGALDRLGFGSTHDRARPAEVMRHVFERDLVEHVRARRQCLQPGPNQ